MSDFSVTAKCPYCKQRFAPDDGYCTCIGMTEYLDSLEDASKYQLEPPVARKTRREMLEQFL